MEQKKQQQKPKITSTGEEKSSHRPHGGAAEAATQCRGSPGAVLGGRASLLPLPGERCRTTPMEPSEGDRGKYYGDQLCAFHSSLAN